jgi:two-component system, NtrC family, sensor kinase
VRAPVRTGLALHALALAASTVALLLAIGLPAAAGGRLGVRVYATVALLAGAGVAVGGAITLIRWVGRPVERLLQAAARLGAGEGLPPLAPSGEAPGHGLTRAAVAFERVAASLADERARLAAKIDELEAANRALAESRESLLRAERLATVGRLAAGVAHEIGNPLGAITAYAELAGAKLAAQPEQAADFVRRIAAETRRIDAIVHDLLDFARPAPLAVAPVRVAPAVDAALRLARVQPRFAGVAVSVDVPDDLPAALADERRFGQVLLNLLLNAADATAGGGRVAIAARVAAGEVLVTVADDGPGIPPPDLGRVFEPFFTTKAPGRGTGLGLSVCHGIMVSLGGGISAENRDGGGALIRLRLRAAPLGAC